MSGVDTAHATAVLASVCCEVNSHRQVMALREDQAATANAGFGRLLAEIRACTICAQHLPPGPRPIVCGLPSARLLVISQAPGTRVHATGLSFNDRSGDRLRAWLGLDRDSFYNEARVAIMAMGFCYPGRDAKGGDLPPRPECAPRWHPRLRPLLPAVALTAGRPLCDLLLPAIGAGAVDDRHHQGMARCPA